MQLVRYYEVVCASQTKDHVILKLLLEKSENRECLSIYAPRIQGRLSLILDWWPKMHGWLIRIHQGYRVDDILLSSIYTIAGVYEFHNASPPVHS